MHEKKIKQAQISLNFRTTLGLCLQKRYEILNEKFQAAFLSPKVFGELSLQKVKQKSIFLLKTPN